MCLIGSFVNKFSFILTTNVFATWVEGFYGNSDEEQDEAYRVSQILFLASQAPAILSVFLTGMIADRVRFWKLYVVVYALAGGSHLLLCLSESSTDAAAYASSIGGTMFTGCEFILLVTLMTKSVPH